MTYRSDQALKYNRTYSDNKKFDHCHNNLDKWLMEWGCSEKMVGMQILKARGGFRENLLEGANTKICESKLTFNITYHPTFRNVTSLFEELQILVALNKEQKTFFLRFWLWDSVMVKALRELGMLEILNNVEKALVKCVFI